MEMFIILIALCGKPDMIIVYDSLDIMYGTPSQLYTDPSFLKSFNTVTNRYPDNLIIIDKERVNGDICT